MVAEAAAGPSQEEEARQASVQELQSLRDSLSQAEAKTRELEGQLENVSKVKHHKFQPNCPLCSYSSVLFLFFLAFCYQFSRSFSLKIFMEKVVCRQCYN